MRKRILILSGALASALLVLLCLGLTAVYIRPAESQSSTQPHADLTDRLTTRINNALSTAMEDLAYIPKVYRIPEGAAAPAPDPAGYGMSDDPAVIQSVIDDAAHVLGGQSIVGWSPDTVLKPGSQVHYYRDDSMLALVWQEVHNDTVCTFSEVKIADASQLRRKLSGDRYGSGIQKTASQLAAEDNAVVAINGDFYAFRTSGIRIWQNRLYLVDGWDIDSCFFTGDGDMLMARRGTITTWDQAQRFMTENDISFSLTFGPILVEDGVNVTPAAYPLGEINDNYSRSIIGQVDSLHYLLMTSNFEVGYTRALLARYAADLMVDKGCHSAYSLDGGQTATLHLGGKLMCNPDYGWERDVSDILCFASAMPEGGVS